MNALKKACFLDRDGVLIEDRNYLSDPADVRLCPHVPEALRLLREHGFLLIVVSNQSGIARGYFTVEDLRRVEARIAGLLAEQGVLLDDVFYCFHHVKGVVPEYAVECTCRKPKPGMLLEAARKHGIDLKESLMIGDKVSDIEAGFAAGCRAAALVRSGHGAEQDLSAFPQAADSPDILSAVRKLLTLS